VDRPSHQYGRSEPIPAGEELFIGYLSPAQVAITQGRPGSVERLVPTASRGKYGTWWLGDWQGIAGGAGAFHLVWNDTRTGKLDLFAATVRP
jgi:hypothetical protein